MAQKRYFSCDFETTVYEGQTFTEVWASAIVELYTDEVLIFHSLSDTLDYFSKLKCNIVAYYHNLKFDGSFWIDFLLKAGFKQSYTVIDADNLDYEWKPNKFMENNEFKYSISDRGQWYTITIKVNGFFIEIRDSLKLLPFSVEKIGKSFGTKHHKLNMEYSGYRYAGCEITAKEREYIANDVLVVKEALEIMFNQGHKKLTIGSCCLSEFKQLTGKYDYDNFFPDVYDFKIDSTVHGFDNAGQWLLRTYKGGWCYLVPEKANKVIHNGITLDVNSLYPSVMYSMSGNRYPVGLPNFWTGNFIPDKALKPNKYYFVHVKTRFYIKHGYLPFIQIKGNAHYKGTEALKTSDVYDFKTKKYYRKYKDVNGNICDTRVDLYLTCTDYQLFLEHYNVEDFEIIDGCYFFSEIGLFDDYINKYKEIKMNSKGAVRESAKLFLNNLYGKLASSTDSSFKVAYLKDDESVGFVPVEAHDKKPGYIPCGSAITSYARNFTIRAAQKNYHGAHNPGFIYADTDSIHCDLPFEEIKGVELHDSEFCHWKAESSWDYGLFVRQKTYIEHVVCENLKPIDEPYLNIKCAGMPKKCKDLFELSLNGYNPDEFDKLTDEELKKRKAKRSDKYTSQELDFISTKRDITDFKIGLVVPGKLLPKRIPGGIVLKDTTYEMR